MLEYWIIRSLDDWSEIVERGVVAAVTGLCTWLLMVVLSFSRGLMRMTVLRMLSCGASAAVLSCYLRS